MSVRRRAAVAPRHGRAVRRRGLAALRFGPFALVLAAVTGTGAGLGTGVALAPAVVPVEGSAAAARASDPPVPRPATGRASERPATAEVDGTGLSASSDAASVLPDGPRLPEAQDLPRLPAPLEPVTPPDDGLLPSDRAAGLLSADVPASASGSLVVVPGTVSAPVAERPVRTVRVEVEDGLPVDPEVFARAVLEILNDPRGWGADGSASFARTDAEDADLRVALASPALTDRMCAPLETEGLLSCGAYGYAVLNFMRWSTATPEFPDRTQYREYLVNHEVGHLLGHGHEQCPGEGAVAPVMQQQTVVVAPCAPNGWPFPDAG